MNYQDKVKDHRVPSAFFPGWQFRLPRLPVPGTVAAEMPAQNDYWASDTEGGTRLHLGRRHPGPSRHGERACLAGGCRQHGRGRERYNISCSACHGASGDGKGITSKYGLNAAANYHDARLIQISDGDIFNTMTNGKGQMIGLGYNISIDDRWRIIMYIRALQRSQNASWDDATPAQQQRCRKR